jgi:hypothetical protein
MKNILLIIWLLLLPTLSCRHARAQDVLLTRRSSRRAATPALLPSPDIAWWKFSEGSGTTIADSSGSHAGTLVGSPTWTTYASGINAVSFNGTSQYVDTALQNLGNASGTITWWMKPSSAFNAGTTRAIAGQEGTGQDFSIQVFSDNNWYAGWDMATDRRATTAATSGNYLNGAWHFYALVWNSSGTALYLDGVSFAVNVSAPSPANIAANFEIASYFAPPRARVFFLGAMTDVRIYSAALTTSQLALFVSAGPQK